MHGERINYAEYRWEYMGEREKVKVHTCTGIEALYRPYSP